MERIGLPQLRATHVQLLSQIGAPEGETRVCGWPPIWSPASRLPKQTVGDLIDDLERMRMVERFPDPDHGVIKRVRLGPKGKLWATEVRRVAQATEAHGIDAARRREKMKCRCARCSKSSRRPSKARRSTTTGAPRASRSAARASLLLRRRRAEERVDQRHLHDRLDLGGGRHEARSERLRCSTAASGGPGRLYRSATRRLVVNAMLVETLAEIAIRTLSARVHERAGRPDRSAGSRGSGW